MSAENSNASFNSSYSQIDAEQYGPDPEDDGSSNANILFEAIKYVHELKKRKIEVSPIKTEVQDVKVEAVKSEPLLEEGLEVYGFDLSDEEQKHLLVTRSLNLNLKIQNHVKEAIINIDKKLDEIDAVVRTVEKTVKSELFELGELNNITDSLRFVGQPFFKSYSYFPCPANQETIRRLCNREIDFTLLAPPLKWQKWELTLLENAIQKSGLMKLQAPLLVKKKMLNAQLKQEEVSGLSTNKTKRLIEQVALEIAKQSGKPLFDLLSNAEKNIDWMRISTVEFQGRRGPYECKTIWKTNLGFGIERDTFSKDENDMLMKLASTLKDWDLIAEKMFSGRTAYQCFIQYQNIMNKKRVEWTAAEDKILVKQVKLSKRNANSTIDFHKVAASLPGRKVKECIERWNCVLNPNISNKAFSQREDRIILDGHDKHKLTFRQLSALFNGTRTPSALRLRYSRLSTQNETCPMWSDLEDVKLIALICEQKRSSSTISFMKLIQNFPNKTRNQLRSRYSYLKEKGAFDFLQKEKQTKKGKKRNSSVLENYNAEKEEQLSALERPKRLARFRLQEYQHTENSFEIDSSTQNKESLVRDFVHDVKARNNAGRRKKRVDFFDNEISNMFKSYYTKQKRGRMKKYFTDEELKELVLVDLNVCDAFKAELDWLQQYDLHQYNFRSENFMSIYRAVRAQKIRTIETALPTNQLLELVTPANITTLVGLRTLLLEKRCLLQMSIQVQNDFRHFFSLMNIGENLIKSKKAINDKEGEIYVDTKLHTSRTPEKIQNNTFFTGEDNIEPSYGSPKPSTSKEVTNFILENPSDESLAIPSTSHKSDYVTADETPKSPYSYDNKSPYHKSPYSCDNKSPFPKSPYMFPTKSPLDSNAILDQFLTSKGYDQVKSPFSDYDDIVDFLKSPHPMKSPYHFIQSPLSPSISPEPPSKDLTIQLSGNNDSSQESECEEYSPELPEPTPEDNFNLVKSSKEASLINNETQLLHQGSTNEDKSELYVQMNDTHNMKHFDNEINLEERNFTLNSKVLQDDIGTNETLEENNTEAEFNMNEGITVNEHNISSEPMERLFQDSPIEIMLNSPVLNNSPVSNNLPEPERIIDPDLAKKLFFLRFYSLFLWPALASQISPNLPDTNSLYEDKRLSYISEYEDDSDEEITNQNVNIVVNESDSIERKIEKTIPTTNNQLLTTLFERKEAFKLRWEKYIKEKEQEMIEKGETEQVLQEKEELEEEEENIKRIANEVERIPGKRGRPSRKRKFRRKKYIVPRKYSDDSSDSE